MALDIPINLDIVDSTIESIPSKTPLIDWEKGKIYGYVDGVEAMKQYVKKTLLTERFVYLIYDGQYGTDSISNISNDAFEAETTRIIKEALLLDKRILNVYNFVFEQTEDEKIIRFSVDTIYGPIHKQEVVISV